MRWALSSQSCRLFVISGYNLSTHLCAIWGVLGLLPSKVYCLRMVGVQEWFPGLSFRSFSELSQHAKLLGYLSLPTVAERAYHRYLVLDIKVTFNFSTTKKRWSTYPPTLTVYARWHVSVIKERVKFVIWTFLIKVATKNLQHEHHSFPTTKRNTGLGPLGGFLWIIVWTKSSTGLEDASSEQIVQFPSRVAGVLLVLNEWWCWQKSRSWSDVMSEWIFHSSTQHWGSKSKMKVQKFDMAFVHSLCVSWQFCSISDSTDPCRVLSLIWTLILCGTDFILTRSNWELLLLLARCTTF